MKSTAEYLNSLEHVSSSRDIPYCINHAAVIVSAAWAGPPPEFRKAVARVVGLPAVAPMLATSSSCAFDSSTCKEHTLSGDERVAEK